MEISINTKIKINFKTKNYSTCAGVVAGMQRGDIV